MKRELYAHNRSARLLTIKIGDRGFNGNLYSFADQWEEGWWDFLEEAPDVGPRIVPSELMEWQDESL